MREFEDSIGGELAERGSEGSRETEMLEAMERVREQLRSGDSKIVEKYTKAKGAALGTRFALLEPALGANILKRERVNGLAQIVGHFSIGLAAVSEASPHPLMVAYTSFAYNPAGDRVKITDNDEEGLPRDIPTIIELFGPTRGLTFKDESDFAHAQEMLGSLHWYRLLTDVVIRSAAEAGCPEVAILPGERNPKLIKFKNPIPQEEAKYAADKSRYKIRFDVTAHRMGFRYDDQRRLFVRQLGRG